MKILLYSGIYDKNGTGNLLRSSYLYDFFAQKGNRVFITSNNEKLAKDITSSMQKEINFLNNYRNQEYDVVIYDSPKFSREKLKNLKNHTRKLVALDFYYSCDYVDLIINLYNHNNFEAKEFKGEIYSGLKYAIIKPEISNNRTPNPNISSDVPKVLVTFGGEDPSSNTYKTLKKIKGKEINGRVLLGPLNKDKELIKNEFSDLFNIMPPSDKIGKLMRGSDAIICGGGTTLLEAIHIGNPIISLPQNKQERDFIDHIKAKIPLFTLDDIDFLVKKITQKDFRKDIKQTYFNLIDGKGKERIYNLIKE